jgi:hypothetical protein
VSYHRIYRYSSIARPLDPAWPTNKAVMILMPVALAAGIGWSLFMSQGVQGAMINGVVFALAVFGSWALGRELLPDDHAAAFVGMAMAFLACLSFYAPGLITLFTTLGLVRMVNRSTGLMARTSDSVVLTLLVIWTIYATQSPWFGAVAALAFVMDASMKGPQRKQLLFAALCIGTMVVYIVDYDVSWLSLQPPNSLLQWLAIATSLLLGLNLLLMKKVHSRGDVGDRRLSPDRVKAGMVIALLACLQGLADMPQVILLLATIAGLCLGMAFRRSFRTTAKGLRHKD